MYVYIYIIDCALIYHEIKFAVQDAFYTPSRKAGSTSGRVKFTSATGYIEERLKTLRQKLSPSKKAHRKHVLRPLSTIVAEDSTPGLA